MQQVSYFYLFDNIKYTSMINCSIYISWKTKFAILTVWKNLKNNFCIDWQQVNSIFHILMKGYIWHTFLTQQVQGQIRGSTYRAPFNWIYFLNFLLKLLLRRALSIFVTVKLTTDCAKKIFQQISQSVIIFP